MFNIVSNANARSYQRTLNGMMATQERKFLTPWSIVLAKTYENAAKQIEHGNKDFTYIINDEKVRALELIQKQYRQNAAFFGTFAFHQFKESMKSIQPQYQKDMETVFWQHISIWSAIQTAEQVKKITDTTKKLLKTEVLRGLTEGLSNAEISKRIRAKKEGISKYRAMMIARTETHTAANSSIDMAIKSTKYDHWRFWVATFDDRVRGANPKDTFDHLHVNGQRRGIDEPFDVSNEKLMYPGDPKGSGGNIIHCRCVLTYITKKSTG